MTKRDVTSQHSFAALDRSAQLFIAGVVGLGFLAIGHSAYVLGSDPVPSQWFLLAALTLLSGSLTIKLPSIPATLSVSETFVFTSVLLFGSAAGTITVTLDGLIISLWLQRKHLGVHKLLFNTTAPALSIWIAAWIFFRLTGASPLNQSTIGIASLLPGLLLFALVYFLLNSWLMATAVSFEEPLSPAQVWRQNFMWLSLSFLSGASASILLVSISREINFSALAVIVPLLAISYLTYHTSLGRVEDANKHVGNLNQLYLSTIETLAMAIDAKDQVTHGHIRRVQERSVSLARYLGVKDDRLLKAVEAASLLHDMGKLAIPEHILNKPGKLTAAEFNVMKTHSSLGADILAAIDFPYPVIPIVRHHHENWDGSGYPDGLSGTDIPIGARILAVVDCYDALTSDRPYRSRLTANEASAILLERRGSMYDPLIVDAFLRTNEERTPLESGFTSATLSSRASSADALAPSGSLPVREANGLNKGFFSTHPLPYSVEVLAKYLTRHWGSLLVLYVRNASTCNLVVAHTWGADLPGIERHEVPVGKQLSGWVAGSRKSIFRDGQPLDFIGGSEVSERSFKGSGAVPITIGNSTVAVMAIYVPFTVSSAAGVETSLELMASHTASFIASVSLSAGST